MLALAAGGSVREGDWLVAERQTAGRGRQGRAWVSPLGNFYGSTLVKLRASDPPAPTLAFAVGIGLVVSIGDPSQLKWPNDLTIRGAKVAGVLLERQGNQIAVGIGVNLQSAPVIEGRATTCLDIDGGQGFTADELLEQLSKWLPWAINSWRQHGVVWVAGRWESEAHLRGTSLSVTLPDGARLEGRFAGLNHDCALRLELPDGTTRVIHAGDVFLI